jgi:hypothetical protein
MIWLSPTEKQGIISEQNMGDISPCPHIKAGQKLPLTAMKSSYIPTQHLYHYYKQQRRQRVPLPQNIRATKEACGIANLLPSLASPTSSMTFYMGQKNSKGT